MKLARRNSLHRTQDHTGRSDKYDIACFVLPQGSGRAKSSIDYYPEATSEGVVAISLVVTELKLNLLQASPLGR